MFTGIVEGAGEIVGVADEAGGRRLAIRAPFTDLHEGQSISVSGVCLTVETYDIHDDPSAREAVARDADAEASTDGGLVGQADDVGAATFEVFLAEETVDRTYLGAVQPGDVVNLERALPANGRFDGHLVQGHVDTVTEVTAIERVGEDWRFTFALPESVGRYVVEKGSVALDGISLTVASRTPAGADGDGDATFAVAIIPTTYDVTTLSEKAVGDPIHVEVDVVAKYVESMLDGYAEQLLS
jgi:riboflavin synthase